jgi:glycerol-3-phosphate dehydrogenase
VGGAPEFDLLVIGGGINGAGVARDAAGRGLRVGLCEQGDLAGATSGASSKLIHGGLRYLEHGEFRLVRESLAEREVLLRNAPHLVWPLRFVLPQGPNTRPAWMLRAGLFLYDHLAGRRQLGASRAVQLVPAGLGQGLKPGITRGFTYWDCWGEDARLVIANVQDAAERGAVVRVRTRVTGLRVEGGVWRATLEAAGAGQAALTARAVVNAAGPWVGRVLAAAPDVSSRYAVRLVKGSHIVLPRLYPGGHAFILQNDDGRVVFMIPFERRYTLVGTTDVPVDGDPAAARCTDEEAGYLCRAVNAVLAKPVRPQDAVWRFSGVRPLFDDGTGDPSKVTRDYVLETATVAGAPLVSVFGGKLTSYRSLAERVLAALQPRFPGLRGAWTERAALPGGDLPKDGVEGVAARLREERPALPGEWLDAVAQRYGSRAGRVIGDARVLDDLGEGYTPRLFAREVAYLAEHEWARTAEDVLWRRTREGLVCDTPARERLQRFVAGQRGVAEAAACVR